MYSVEFKDDAKKEIFEIVSYIRGELGNPAAADRLLSEIVIKAQKIADFPYSYPALSFPGPARYEYRKALVRKYLIAYYIDEKNKAVNIAHVLYAMRDIRKLLK